MASKKLAIVLPAYNEEEVIEKTTARLHDLLTEMIQANLVAPSSFIMYVDDGSKDKTWALINELHEKYGNVQGLRFSTNFGHQNALIAGMTYLTDTDVDYVVTIDADLQDDPQAIVEMVELANSGKDIVYGCLLYTSDAADEEDSVDLGGRSTIKKKKTKKIIP